MAQAGESWPARLAGDGPEQTAALAELRDALMRGLRKALAGRSGVDDAFLEDTVQDSLVRILDRLDQFEGRSRFLTWATSIVIRTAMTELRRRRWKDVSLDGAVLLDFAPRTTAAERVGAKLERRAILDKLHELIQNELSDKQRRALVAELQGMPQEEIARHLGSNRNAVYKLTHDARKRLKRALEAAGYEAADVYAAFAT